MPVPYGIKTAKTVVKGLSNHDNDSYNVKNDSHEHKNSSMTHATRFFNTFIWRSLHDYDLKPRIFPYTLNFFVQVSCSSHGWSQYNKPMIGQWMRIICHFGGEVLTHENGKSGSTETVNFKKYVTRSHPKIRRSHPKWWRIGMEVNFSATLTEGLNGV